MKLIALQRLLLALRPVNAYLDNVPENATLPAVSYKHLNHNFTTLLDGSKTGNSDRWELKIVTVDDADIEMLVNQLETLHNSSNSDYQRIFVTVGSIGTKVKDQPFRSTTVNIQTYEV